ncbi:MAG TPA: tryptophanase [Candidatus Binatia bacterium]
MNERSSAQYFSIPYEIAAVRPLRQTTREERKAALAAAYYNTELLPQSMIYLDFKTDSGVSSFSTAQLTRMLAPGGLESGMEMAAEGNKAFVNLSQAIQSVFGFPYILPVSQGRTAERIWTKIHIKQASIVPGNMLFPSTRYHIDSNGGRVIDVIAESAHDLYSGDLFKGNIDLRKLESVLEEHGGNVSCVYVELCVNGCGGHPVSLGNLKAVQSVCKAHNVPLFLDACRILENSALIKAREEGQRQRSIREIVHDLASCADGLTMSALKDFLVPAGGLIATRDESSYQKAYFASFFGGDQATNATMESMAAAIEEIFADDNYVSSRVGQVEYLWSQVKDAIPVLQPCGGHAVFVDVKRFLPDTVAERNPGEALAAFVYECSGMRVTKGPPLAASQRERGIDLLRLAIPARRYLREQIDDAAEALRYAYAHRAEIGGLKKVEQPGRSRFAPALFAPA